jgi:hypothetical protein
MDPLTMFADPGKYQYYSCGQLASQRTYWAGREQELQLLLDMAKQGTGGAVQCDCLPGDFLAAREELKVIDATVRAKNCDKPRRT